LGISVLARCNVPDDAREREQPLDVLGAVLVTAGLGGITWALTVESGRRSWTADTIFAALAGAALLVLFVLVQRRRGDRALIPLQLFASRNLVALNAVTFFGTAILLLTWALGPHRSPFAGVFWVSLLAALFLTTVLRECRQSQFGSSMNQISLLFLPANACWALLCVWIFVGRDHPIGFASYPLALAVVHFALIRAVKTVPRVRASLYLVGHGCLIVMAMRLLAYWAERTASPVNLISVMSESDSVFLAIYAAIMLAVAVVRRSTPDRLLGLTLMSIVVGKLYLYDVWQLTRFYRITAFVALGAILLAASFIYSRFHARPTAKPN